MALPPGELGKYELIRRIGGRPVACSFVIELAALRGRGKLGDVPVHSLLEF